MLISPVTWPSPSRSSSFSELTCLIIPYILFALEVVGRSQPGGGVVEGFLTQVQVLFGVVQDCFVAELVGVEAVMLVAFGDCHWSGNPNK